MSLLDIIVVAAFVVALLEFIRAKIYLDHTRERAQQELDDYLRHHLIPVKVERHHDQFFLWRSDNDDFLAQGYNADELVTKIHQRFGNDVILALKSGDPEHLRLLEEEFAQFQGTR